MPQQRGDRLRFRNLTGAQRWLLAAIIVVAALRIGWNNVETYSPADETVYANYTRTLVERGFFRAYPEIARTFENESQRWVYPSPVTQTLLQALGAIPRENTGADHTMVFSLVCAALIALWWMWPRDRAKQPAKAAPVRPVRPARVLRARHT